MIKKCSKCKQSKTFLEFNKNAKGVMGLTAWCKACVSEYTKMYKERRKQEGPKKYVEYKVCARCEQEKPRSQYGKRTLSLDGLNVYCKACVRVLHQISVSGRIYKS